MPWRENWRGERRGATNNEGKLTYSLLRRKVRRYREISQRRGSGRKYVSNSSRKGERKKKKGKKVLLTSSLNTGKGKSPGSLIRILVSRDRRGGRKEGKGEPVSQPVNTEEEKEVRRH